jgi:hypothetical protein
MVLCALKLPLDVYRKAQVQCDSFGPNRGNLAVSRRLRGRGLYCRIRRGYAEARNRNNHKVSRLRPFFSSFPVVLEVALQLAGSLT